MPKLAHSLNRSVFVAIPAFFGDPKPRRCTLIDIEPAGLWFSGDAVNEELCEFEDAAPPGDALARVFFPFDQILCVFDSAQFAYLARGLGSHNTPMNRGERASAGGRSSHRDRHHDGRSKQKNSNRTR